MHLTYVGKTLTKECLVGAIGLEPYPKPVLGASRGIRNKCTYPYMPLLYHQFLPEKRSIKGYEADRRDKNMM